jgi:hypothetical protein
MPKGRVPNRTPAPRLVGFSWSVHRDARVNHRPRHGNDQIHGVGNALHPSPRDLVHRFYQEQHQLNGGRENRYVTGSDTVGLAWADTPRARCPSTPTYTNTATRTTQSSTAASTQPCAARAPRTGRPGSSRILLAPSALPQPRPEPADLRALTSAANTSLRRSESAICLCPGAHSTAEVLTLRSRQVVSRAKQVVSRANRVGSTLRPLRMFIARPAAFVTGRSASLGGLCVRLRVVRASSWLPVAGQMS